MNNTFDVETRVKSPSSVIQKPNGAGLLSTGSVDANAAPDGTTGTSKTDNIGPNFSTSFVDTEGRQLVAAPALRSSKPLFDVRLISSQALLERPIEPRRFLLEPWLRQKDVVLVYARRGIGKTLFGLGLAYAVGSGSEFLRFKAPESRRVLYIDGEMPIEVMRDRLAAIEKGSNRKVTPDFLQFLCADDLDGPMVDLGLGLGQRELEPHLKGFDLIIVDNISTIVRSVNESDGDGWKLVQQWLLNQRRAGRSVLFIHHAGKNGAQRGTSKREDIADTVLSLTRPEGYKATEGARFVINFEKARGFTGDDAEPLEARYETIDGIAHWTWKPIVDEDYEQMKGLFEQGMTVRQIGKELSIPKSTVGRLRQRWQAEEAGEDDDEEIAEKEDE
jgi:putative DNA primase/helicase